MASIVHRGASAARAVLAVHRCSAAAASGGARAAAVLRPAYAPRRPANPLHVRAFAAKVDIAAVKALREATGAPMMECKQALSDPDVGGDLDKAVDWLRKKGMAAASKKAGRTAANGLVGVFVEGTSGAIVEINSETDFVARNELFSGLVARAADAAYRAVSTAADAAASGVHEGESAMADLHEAPLPGGDSSGAAIGVGAGVTELAGKVRENLVLRRVARLDAGEGGVVAGYIHNSMGPSVGTIGCLLALGTEPAALSANGGAADALGALARKLAMQVVAARPLYHAREAVPAEAVEKERALLRDQAAASGKPAAIIEKMVEGRLGKFYGETVLVEQECVVGEEGKVADVLKRASADLLGGAPLEVRGFVHFRVGEGVDTASGEDSE